MRGNARTPEDDACRTRTPRTGGTRGTRGTRTRRSLRLPPPRRGGPAALAAAAAVTALALGLGGCSHNGPVRGGSGEAAPPGASATGSPAAGPIPVGPGPKSDYTFQQQPPADSCHLRSDGGQPLPDPSCTPGALNPKVTQAGLRSTICRSGYTSDIRPSSSITGREKKANAKSYGYTGSLRDAEYDHLVSLELGGDPNDPRNLWVEPPSPGHRSGAGPNNPKDSVESRLHSAVCSGKVTLAAAQQAIASDWTTAESRLGIKP